LPKSIPAVDSLWQLYIYIWRTSISPSWHDLNRRWLRMESARARSLSSNKEGLHLGVFPTWHHF
jgi:hypothetical protein